MITVKNGLSILLGCLGAAAAFFILLFLCAATGLFGWADGGDPEYLRRLKLTTMLSLYTSIFFGATVGGYVTYKISRAKYTHFITAAVLLILLVLLSEEALMTWYLIY